MPDIQIKTGEITDLEGGVIICPCDTNLTNTRFGIIKKVLAKAGDNLLKELTVIGYSDIGHVIITQGYDLATKNIIFMPVQDIERDDKTDYIRLHQSLRNAFILAALYQLQSLAIPSINLLRKKTSRIDDFKSMLMGEDSSNPIQEYEIENIIITISKDFQKSSIKKILIYK